MTRTLTMIRIGPWNVRIVHQGEKYGLDDCLTHDEQEPLVEFYDAEQDASKFGPRGQFVNRYRESNILSMNPMRGLAVHGGVPRWTATPSQMFAIIDWAQDQAIYDQTK